jgi:hypothetical protein
MPGTSPWEANVVTIPLTQPEPEHIARAGGLLQAVLLGDVDIEARLAVVAALATLRDVYPPYRPSLEPVPALTLELGVGVTLALGALEEAARCAGSVEEVIRIGFAGRELCSLRGRAWFVDPPRRGVPE